MEIEVKTNKSGSRTYTIDSRKLPSVTTILGLIAKPQLIPWAAKMTVEAAEQLIVDNAIHNLLEGTLMLYWKDKEGYMGLENILIEAKKAHRVKKKEAADIGTQVHDAIQNFFESGCKMTVDEVTDNTETQQIKQGFNNFMQWTFDHDVEVLAWEQVATDGELFAGRYDLLAKIDGILTLCDFKTSKAIYEEYFLQVHAYASTVPDCKAIAVLRLDKDSPEIEYVSKPYNPDTFEAFHLLAQYYALTNSK